MADEEFNFNATEKKKKKTSKKTFNLEGDEVPEAIVPVTGGPIGDEDFDQKKKKKKKKVFNPDDLESVGAGAPDDKDDGLPEEDKEEEESIAEPELDFSLTKKKKKKKKALAIDEDVDEDGDPDTDKGDLEVKTGAAWLNTDRDYTYDELLTLVFDIIREKNPESTGDKKKLLMRPPQVVRVGTKKTSFANFIQICKQVHRPPKHLQSFLLAELGTSGSVDANDQLIIKGRFVQKQIESVLRKYIKEYVACNDCRSPNTLLQKDARLFFLQCEACGSRRSVAPIKSGFQAVTGKRAAIRAKAN